MDLEREIEKYTASEVVKRQRVLQIQIGEEDGNKTEKTSRM